MASSLVIWNRLEPQGKTNDLSVALRCEVRDALWMLGRQWQMGEFRAEDAGSCAFVKVESDSVFAERVSLKGGTPRVLSPDSPINFSIEGVAPLEAHSPTEGEAPLLSLDLRVEFGRYWLRLLKAKLPAAKASTTISKFQGNTLLHFRLPTAETEAEQVTHAPMLANLAFMQTLAALSSGRVLDGWQLFKQLQTQQASNFLPQPDSAVDQLGDEFKKWVTESFPSLAKDASSGWDSSRLEYRFDCTTPNGSGPATVLRVAEHDGSYLDWHTFEQGVEGTALLNPRLQRPLARALPLRRSSTLLPRAVTFPGAPRNRWWEMEDSTIDLANLQPSASDPAHLVLAEFALLFSNDWISFPLDLPVGSLSRLTQLAVTDVFGGVTSIRPTPQTESWGFFSIAAHAGSALWLPPAAATVKQGPAKTEVMLLRDEMANLAWGIENLVPDGRGCGMDGLEAATLLREWLMRMLNIVPEESVEPASSFADRQYVLGTTVPENWIPFVPIRFDQSGQMRLRRAALPRTLGERAPTRVRPRTLLLREGLESHPVQPFDLNEEEITMPGIVVREFWRQARWFDGTIFTWLAREKAYARPSRASGLQFDTVKGLR